MKNAVIITSFVVITLLAAFSAPASRFDGPTEEKLGEALMRLRDGFGLKDGGTAVVIEIGSQRLFLIKGNVVLLDFPVSTSSYGTGSGAGSNKTPLGVHRIAEKIGSGAPLGTLFSSRKDTGKIADIITEAYDSDEDYVTSRILWLRGAEYGLNAGSGVDSYKRFIYIHGTNEEGLIGTPASHGCVRMRNRDVIELFDYVSVGTLVYIIP